MRFNQPFGDTVNRDLLPDVAIDRLDLVGSNPVFARVDEAME
jgi:iron complex outermembrane recepter protein